MASELSNQSLLGIQPYKVTVYREAKDGAGYTKIKEYGEENSQRAEIPWMKKTVYAVMWEKEGEVGGSAAGERGDNEYGRGAPARAIVVGTDREQSVASEDSRPFTCGVGSVWSAEGNNLEQQHKAVWAWRRREDALGGPRERTEDGVVVEHMDRKDVNSLWAVLCALQGRPNGEDQLKMIRQGVATRLESRHKAGAMEECLPPEEVSWQRYIQRTTQGRRMGEPPEMEAWAAEGGYKVAVYRETKSGEGYRKLVKYGNRCPLDAGILGTRRRVCAVWGSQE